LNETLYEQLRIIAAKENRSLNNLLEYAAQKYVEDYENRIGPITLPSGE